MPKRRGKPESIPVGRDTRGRFVPVGAFVAKRVGPAPVVPVRVRRDPRTGQFVGKRPPVFVPRHPRSGRFITKAEFDAIKKKPIVDLVRGFISQSPRLRVYVGTLSPTQKKWFHRRMIHWQTVGFEPRMAAKITIDEFERGQEFETEEQVPQE